MKVLMIVALLLSACKPPERAHPRDVAVRSASDLIIREKLESAALDKLWPVPSYTKPAPTVEQAQAWIDRNRLWAESIQDKKISRAYLKWIDSEQGTLDRRKAVEELVEKMPTPPKWNDVAEAPTRKEPQ